MTTKIDPFELEVMKSCFDAIADDMALTLMRTAHSGIVRDSLDFSTAICDPEGLTLAQGICTPLQMGSFHDAMRKMIAVWGGRVYPGDVFIFNDPFVADGQHLPDIYIITPIFFEEAIRGWATTIAHHSDVGGIVAGSNALGATEIFQEGLRLPIIKFIERDVPNAALHEVIALNVRTPDKVLGDLQAQVAACKIGEREMVELFRRYGTERVRRHGEALQDYAERLVRAELRDIPDGVYTFTDHIDGLGRDPQTIYLKVKVEVRGDSLAVDWTGSSTQVEGGINPSFPFTKSATYAAVRSIMSADIPNCHGFTRPIEIFAPVGSILNPTFPAPSGARGITGFRVIDCMFGALAQAVPDRVMADGSGGSTLPTIAGYRNGKPFVFCETFMGTWGGTHDHDGLSGVPHMGANQSNVPIEMIETDYPLRIEEYGFVPDTGGPGLYRGGIAIARQYRLLCGKAILNVRSDKRKYPPHGLFGGKPGAPSINILNPANNSRVLPVLMTEVESLVRNDVYRHVMSGGGGYGDPLDREPNRVLRDVIEEKVSIAHAAREYGVVIVSGDPPTIDEEASLRLRAQLRDAANAPPVHSDPSIQKP
jgi:N-methylhydantoinase B